MSAVYFDVECCPSAAAPFAGSALLLPPTPSQALCSTSSLCLLTCRFLREGERRERIRREVSIRKLGANSCLSLVGLLQAQGLSHVDELSLRQRCG